MTSGKSFELWPISRAGEGKWGPELKWNGAIAEWSMQGVAVTIEAVEASSMGVSPERVRLSIHVSRKYAFYFWKALLPLYMVTALNLTALAFDVDDLSDRIATSARPLEPNRLPEYPHVEALPTVRSGNVLPCCICHALRRGRLAP